MSTQHSDYQVPSLWPHLGISTVVHAGLITAMLGMLSRTDSQVRQQEADFKEDVAAFEEKVLEEAIESEARAHKQLMLDQLQQEMEELIRSQISAEKPAERLTELVQKDLEAAVNAADAQKPITQRSASEREALQQQIRQAEFGKLRTHIQAVKKEELLVEVRKFASSEAADDLRRMMLVELNQKAGDAIAKALAGKAAEVVKSSDAKLQAAARKGVQKEAIKQLEAIAQKANKDAIEQQGVTAAANTIADALAAQLKALGLEGAKGEIVAAAAEALREALAKQGVDGGAALNKAQENVGAADVDGVRKAQVALKQAAEKLTGLATAETAAATRLSKATATAESATQEAFLPQIASGMAMANRALDLAAAATTKATELVKGARENVSSGAIERMAEGVIQAVTHGYIDGAKENLNETASMLGGAAGTLLEIADSLREVADDLAGRKNATGAADVARATGGQQQATAATDAVAQAGAAAVGGQADAAGTAAGQAVDTGGLTAAVDTSTRQGGLGQLGTLGGQLGGPGGNPEAAARSSNGVAGLTSGTGSQLAGSGNAGAAAAGAGAAGSGAAGAGAAGAAGQSASGTRAAGLAGGAGATGAAGLAGAGAGGAGAPGTAGRAGAGTGGAGATGAAGTAGVGTGGAGAAGAAGTAGVGAGGAGAAGAAGTAGVGAGGAGAPGAAGFAGVGAGGTGAAGAAGFAGVGAGGSGAGGGAGFAGVGAGGSGGPGPAGFGSPGGIPGGPGGGAAGGVGSFLTTVNNAKQVEYNRETYEVFVKDLQNRTNPNNFYGTDPEGGTAVSAAGIQASVAQSNPASGPAIVYVSNSGAVGKARKQAADVAFKNDVTRGVAKPQFPTKAFAVAEMISRPLTIDGDIADWGTLKHPITMQYGPYKQEKVKDGPTLYMRWSPDGLYFTWKVTKDPKTIEGNPENPYNGDCMELFVDMDNARKSDITVSQFAHQFAFDPFGCAGVKDNTICEIGFGLRGIQTHTQQWLKDGKAAAKVLRDGYQVEAYLPRIALAKRKLLPGEYLAVNFSINQGTNWDLQRQWAVSKDGVPESWRKPETWGDILLLGSDADSNIVPMRGGEGVSSAREFVCVGDPLAFEVIDRDMNLSPHVVDRVAGIANLDGQTTAGLLIVMEETGDNTGVFRGSIDTQSYVLPFRANTLNVRGGDIINFTYVDARAAYGEVNREIKDQIEVAHPIIVVAPAPAQP